LDLAEGRFPIEWGTPQDLHRALEIDRTYCDLSLGLVDGVVMAVAERLEARAIVTLDLRDFGPVTLKGQPEIWPRDL
jgi:predicted nucleic acid-binding protein